MTIDELRRRARSSEPSQAVSDVAFLLNDSIDAPVAVGPDAQVRIHVCVTCTDRRSGPGHRAGQRLYANLVAENRDPAVEIVPIECLAVCRPNCALSFAAEGKWTYIHAVPSDADVADILEGARIYAAASKGLIPWRERPNVLKGIVARAPPMPRR